MVPWTKMLSFSDRGATHLPGGLRNFCRRFPGLLRGRVPDLPDGDRHGVGPAGSAQALWSYFSRGLRRRLDGQEALLPHLPPPHHPIQRAVSQSREKEFARNITI